MSLKESLDKAIDNIITDFMREIALTYKLNEDNLRAIWRDKVDTGSSVQLPETVSEDVKLTPAYLAKCKKPELQALCKKYGVKTVGTKAVLIGYLQNKDSAPEAKSPKVKSTAKSKQQTPKLLKSISDSVPVIAIRKNQFGNHEHPETRLTFDKKLKKVIGIQQDDGSVRPLTKDDIDTCNKFKFSYITPSNLDTGGKLEDEVVEELDDDDDDIVEDEEEVLEEEEDDDDIVEEEEEVLEDEDVLEEEEWEEY